MRGILFRGKRVDDNEWIYGDYFHIQEAKAHFISTDERNNRVYPESISEFTGLLDKTRRQIFEGDILKVSSSGSSYYAKVEYDCGCFWVSNPDIQIPDTINNFKMEFVEVVGNIYDNPELLGEKS